MFDPNNKIVLLCAKGMEAEATRPGEAKALFLAAWQQSVSDFEKFTAAHYVARHQETIAGKLQWDKTALEFAMKIDDDKMQANYPSLYLNIAKCYEDLGDYGNAKTNYLAALSYENQLPGDGYGEMIKQGIRNGIMRVAVNGE